MAPSAARPGFRRQQLAHHAGGLSVTLFEEVAVGVQGGGGIGVAQPTGHGADVHAHAQQLGSGEVAQLMDVDGAVQKLTGLAT